MTVPDHDPPSAEKIAVGSNAEAARRVRFAGEAAAKIYWRHADDEPLADALGELRSIATLLEVLGSYPVAVL